MICKVDVVPGLVRTLMRRLSLVALGAMVAAVLAWPAAAAAQANETRLYIGSGSNLAVQYLYNYSPFHDTQQTVFWNTLYRGPARRNRLVLYKPQWRRYYINVWDKEISPDFDIPRAPNIDYLERLKVHVVAGIRPWSSSVRGTGISERDRKQFEALQRLRERMIGEGALRHAYFGWKEKAPWVATARGLAGAMMQRSMQTVWNPLLMDAQMSSHYVDPFATSVLGRPREK